MTNQRYKLHCRRQSIPTTPTSKSGNINNYTNRTAYETINIIGFNHFGSKERAIFLQKVSLIIYHLNNGS